MMYAAHALRAVEEFGGVTGGGHLPPFAGAHRKTLKQRLPSDN